MLLVPISGRHQSNRIIDDMAMPISILYYGDVREALLEALGD